MNDHDETQWPTPALDNEELRMSYNIARGEQGVLTFEPYKVRRYHLKQKHHEDRGQR